MSAASTNDYSITIDLTRPDSSGNSPTVDLRSTDQHSDAHGRSGRAEAIDVSTIDLTVVELTVLRDDGDAPFPDLRSWGGWAPHDRTEIGQIVTPPIVATARRLFNMMYSGRPLLKSQGTYYQTHRRFSVDYVRRNLAAQINDRAQSSSDVSPTDTTETIHAAQFRMEYFCGLADEEFEACYRFTGEITRDYLLHANRSDRLYAEYRQPTPPITATARRKRKAKAVRQQ